MMMMMMMMKMMMVMMMMMKKMIMMMNLIMIRLKVSRIVVRILNKTSLSGHCCLNITLVNIQIQMARMMNVQIGYKRLQQKALGIYGRN